MTAGVLRRALLLGCNSEGLEHCERDANCMAEALTRCGFEVAGCLTSSSLSGYCDGRMATPNGLSPVAEVTEQIRGFLSDCRRGDSALLYFSGHSCFDHGVFNLVVGETPTDTGHLLALDTLIGLFKQHRKPAEQLLILDCCEGEAAADDEFWNQAAGAWVRIWVAARTNEHAQELDESTQGGLFTSLILRALSDEGASLADAGGRLRISAVDGFVRDQTRKYRSKTGKPPPRPGLYGNTSHDILLAEGLARPPATGFSPDALARLRDMLHASGLGDATLARHWAEVMSASGLSAADGYRGPTGLFDTVGLDGALSNLGQAWHRPLSPVPIPLAEFVERIARVAPETNAQKLRALLRDAIQGLARGQDLDGFIASLALGQTDGDPAKTRPKSHLAIALSPCDANTQTQYAVEARLVDSRGFGDSVLAPVESVSSQGMPEMMRRALNQPAVTEAIRDPEGLLTIEFFLPVRLLGEDIDDWTPSRTSDKQAPFSERHRVTVRALVRLGPETAGDERGASDAEPYIAGWVHQWRACAPCRAAKRRAKKVPPCCIWLSEPKTSYRRMTKEGGCVFVLGFKPTTEDLDLMLRHGLAAILWAGEPLDARFMTTLLAAVAATRPNSPKQPCLADLPFAVLDLRQDAWDQTSGKTGGYHLLWDDPDRIPAFTGRRARATAEQPTLRLRSPF